VVIEFQKHRRGIRTAEVPAWGYVGNLWMAGEWNSRAQRKRRRAELKRGREIEVVPGKSGSFVTGPNGKA
jgi:hypothetical protein